MGPQHSEATGQRSPDSPAPEDPRAEARKLSAPGPSRVGKGRQAPSRRTEPTGGVATSWPRCALSAGPSALPSLAAEGSPRPQFPVAAHPEDEIEDEEQHILKTSISSGTLQDSSTRLRLQRHPISWTRQLPDSCLFTGRLPLLEYLDHSLSREIIIEWNWGPLGSQ